MNSQNRADAADRYINQRYKDATLPFFNLEYSAERIARMNCEALTAADYVERALLKVNDDEAAKLLRDALYNLRRDASVRAVSILNVFQAASSGRRLLDAMRSKYGFDR